MHILEVFKLPLGKKNQRTLIIICLHSLACPSSIQNNTTTPSFSYRLELFQKEFGLNLKLNLLYIKIEITCTIGNLVVEISYY